MTDAPRFAEGVFIHPTALVEPGAELGPRTRVWDYAKVRKGARLGPDCNLGQNVYVDCEVTIGARVKIQNNVSVYHGVSVGDDVFIGPNATFTNDRTPRAAIWNDERLGLTVLAYGASIGANSTIVCGTKDAPRLIGRYALVAAGAVVTRDVPDYALVAGNPARIIGFVTPCGEGAKEFVAREDKDVILRAPISGETIRVPAALYDAPAEKEAR